MTRASLVLFVLLAAVSATAQRAAPFPATLRGHVHRTRVFGCGQAWDASEAWSDTTLTLRGASATLVVDGQWRDATGGVRRLVDVEGESGPYHSESDHHARIEWRGHARREGDALTIALRGLAEMRDVTGTPTTVTSRSSLAATLTCTREDHDLFTHTRPADRADEAPVTRRALVSCTFEPTEREPLLPRPVVDLLTLPFFLDEGAGVTTDADYEGYVSATAPYLVARQPGGMARPAP